MTFFTASRIGRFQWGASRVCRHYILRGVLLLLFGRLVNPPFIIDRIVDQYEGRPPSSTHGPMEESLWIAAWVSVFEVMTALGFVMIVAGILMPLVHHLSHWKQLRGLPLVHYMLLLLAFGGFALSNALLVHYQNGDPENSDAYPGWERGVASTWWQILLRYLLIPGSYGDSNGNQWGNIAYPLVPWLSVTWIGVVMGHVYKEACSLRRATRGTGVLGVASLVLFNVVRGWGGSFGNLRGSPRHEGEGVVSGFIGWLDVCKYPPSPAFALLTLGMNWVRQAAAPLLYIDLWLFLTFE